MASAAKVWYKGNRHTLGGFLREILNAQVWKEAHEASRDFDRGRSRWRLKPVCVIGLLIGLDEGDRSLQARFEEAAKIYDRLFPKRRRSGKIRGFMAALKAVPLEVLEVLQKRIQEQLVKERINPYQVGRWNGVGVDGSKQNLPRTQAHEAHYGLGGKKPGLPQRVIVNVVGLRSELLVEWACGKAKASERQLVMEAIRRLPQGTMVVGDAGFPGYDWIDEVVGVQGKHVLIRVGANVNLLAEQVRVSLKSGGRVWLWSKEKRRHPPLVLRLICIARRTKRTVKRKKRGQNGRQKRGDVVRFYFLTDVLDAKALTNREAWQLYAKRWPCNEGMFRNWKQTMKCDKAISRTPEIAERELSTSLLGYVLIQTMILIARKRRRKREVRISIAAGRKAWRRALEAMKEGKTTRWFARELSEAVVDEYDRQGPKSTREWPRKKKHKPMKSPKVRRLHNALKAEGMSLLEAKQA